MRHGICIPHYVKVYGFGYRTNEPSNCILTMDADEELHHKLAVEANVRYDNHQTFVLQKEDGSRIVILFSDNFMLFGTDIRFGSW